jgi:NADH:ubiquinone oxidoreductase subunit H
MLAIDPLLIGDLDLGDVLIVLLKVVVIFVIGLVATMLMVWFERKAIAGMQNRIGPNKAGPIGILQTLADGIKLFFKEDLIPERSDRFVFKLAPYLSFVPAFLVWTIIPLGGDFTGDKNGIVTWFGRQTRVQLADPQIGVLLLLALSGIAVYGIMLAGWSSGSKYPLLGSVRASAQMVSYEAALGMSMAAVLLLAGTLSTSGIVSAQHGTGNWHLISTGILPFVIFMIAATAELNRPPFDLVEAEQELVGGFNTEFRTVLPGRVHEHDHDERRHRHTVLRWSPAPHGEHRRHPLGWRPHARSAQRHRVVPAEAHRVPVRLRVVPGNAASSAVRPADEPRLEGAHPAVARLVHAPRCVPAGSGRELEPVDRADRVCGGALRVCSAADCRNTGECPQS